MSFNTTGTIFHTCPPPPLSLSLFLFLSFRRKQELEYQTIIRRREEVADKRDAEMDTKRENLQRQATLRDQT